MVPSGNTLTILVLGVYPVTVVIAVAALEKMSERSDKNYGSGSGDFFAGVLWPLVLVILVNVLTYQHFKNDHPYENTVLTRITNTL